MAILVAMRTSSLISAFRISQRTGTEDSMGNPVVNPNFLGDYSVFDNFTWGVDVKVDSIVFFLQ